MTLDQLMEFESQDHPQNPEEKRVRAFLKSQREVLTAKVKNEETGLWEYKWTAWEIIQLAVDYDLPLDRNAMYSVLVNFRAAINCQRVENLAAKKEYEFDYGREHYARLKRQIDPRLNLRVQWKRLHYYMTAGIEFRKAE